MHTAPIEVDSGNIILQSAKYSVSLKSVILAEIAWWLALRLPGWTAVEGTVRRKKMKVPKGRLTSQRIVSPPSVKH